MSAQCFLGNFKTPTSNYRAPPSTPSIWTTSAWPGEVPIAQVISNPCYTWTHRAETSKCKHDSQSRGKVVPSSEKCHWLRWALGRRWAVTAACDRDKQEQVGDLTCFSPSSHPREQLRSCLPRALKYYFELFASHYLIYLLKPDRGKGKQNFLKAFWGSFWLRQAVQTGSNGYTNYNP